MADPTPEQQKALDEFKQISDILAVPALGQPLLEHRKWRVPCPDDLALADFPDDIAKLKNWKEKWASCKGSSVIPSQAEQSGKASEKQGR
jgi:hypothetical protein